MEKKIHKPEWVPENSSDAFASFVVPAQDNSDVKPNKFEKKIIHYSIDEYKKGLINNDRVILSKAITLIESNSSSHFETAQSIITQILPYTGKSIRIGITGSPGVGKSTFIESFGKYLTENGHKVAVLAIDPTSTRSRGSILGDKTRMEELSRDKNAFIRPSPSGGTLGGVARKTRETMLLCEAAGYDVILVETVGVGQSEVTVHSMVDFFLVLLLPGAGDELQGIKKGVIELADGVVINKAEGDYTQKAQQTKAAYQNALHLLSQNIPDIITKVLTASALNNIGISDVWDEITNYIRIVRNNGFFEKRRKKQWLDWFNSLLHEALMNKILNNQIVKLNIQNAEKEISELKMSPVLAVEKLVKLI